MLHASVTLSACNDIYKGDIVINKVNISENEIDKNVTDVNFYTTLGTFPTLYAALDLFSKDEISYIWFERTGTLNIDALPEKTELITDTGTYSPDIMNAIVNKVNYASKKYPNAKLHLYCDDLRVQFVPLCFSLLGIPENKYDVKLLSDGTATYNNFNSLYAADYTIGEWNKQINSLNSAFSECAKGRDKVIDISNNSQYSGSMFGAALRSNVEYWLQYPQYLRSADKDITAALAEGNYIYKLPENMYAQLTDGQKTAFLNAVGLDKSEFDATYFNAENDKPYLVITGKKPINGGLTDDGFKNVIEQLLADYGSTYNILYKPHPTGLPDTENGYEQYFAQKNIKVLPGKLPMEVLLWVYPNLKLGGFNSTLYMSAPKGNTLFFIASDKTVLSAPLQLLFDDLFADAVFYQPK